MEPTSLQHALVLFGDARSLRSAKDCRGLCFDASADLAREAVRLGLGHKAWFVRWTVLGDPGFLEHWAIRLDDGTVLDPTAAQVDGDPQPVRRIDGYPQNYAKARFYPVPLVLAAVILDKAPGSYRYSGRAIWSVHHALFRHDVAHAVSRRSAQGLAGDMRALARCAFKLAAGHLLRRAITYRRGLSSRPK